MEVKKILLDKIVFNPWNPNIIPEEKFKTLVKNIKAEGDMLQPILVRPGKAVDTYECIDGENRTKASKQAGLKEIMCVVVLSDTEEAKIRTLSFNNLRGINNPDKLKVIIKELEKSIGVEEIQKLTAITMQEINRAISDLDFSGLSPDEIKEKLIHEMGVDPEQAEAMAQVYAFGGEGLAKTDITGKQTGLRPFITFYFEDEASAKKVTEFFKQEKSNEPDSKKLLKIVYIGVTS